MIGQSIGNFRIVGELGKGGMGEVFLAQHEKIGTKVAIKMLLPHISSNTDLVQRFFNEAIAASKITHAGIGKIFDVGFNGTGRAYLVMEFLSGETLGSRIHRLSRLPLGQIAEIGKQIASVLDAVHKAGITHRDLKPDNIFIVPDSELDSGERIKILDFGIAKLADQAGVTMTGAGAMGTPEYMSPEQWKNVKNVDWRADAYSLGCLTFEMATGRRPFLGESVGEYCTKHLLEPPPRVSSFAPLAAPLDALVDRMLAKEPAARPASMKEIGTAFASLAKSAPGAGLAPTLLPDASAASAVAPTLPPTFAPDHLPAAPAHTSHVATPPAAPATTLGASSGEREVRPEPNRSRGKWLALSGTLVALAAVVTIVVLKSSSSGGDHVATNELERDATAARVEAATTMVDADAAERTNVAAAMSPPADAAVAATSPPDSVVVATVQVDAARVRTSDNSAANVAKKRDCSTKLVDRSAACKKQFCDVNPDSPKCSTDQTEVTASTNCDAEAAKEKGMSNINMGLHAAALAQFEASLRCQDDPYVRQLAFMESCASGNSAKAKFYYKKLTPAQQNKFAQICIRQKPPVAYE